MLIMSCPDDAAGPRGEGEGWREDGDLNLWRPLTIDPIMISSERRTPPPSLPPGFALPAIGEEGFLCFSGDVSFCSFHDIDVAVAMKVLEGALRIYSQRKQRHLCVGAIKRQRRLAVKRYAKEYKETQVKGIHQDGRRRSTHTT